ncbi:MAG: tRNA (adenosine(37)-N6)-threonylcarbamoyltransferase complex transferase subunit TsaD [Verrucomicrobia subdivision 3 bacterium]|nr:tRNA (adenosine(37)-N6)-threonylcarbamoyltransferase complex transferase subunit TsaD [Limisphaerales bacterium]
MRLLAIETSCDETSAAVIVDGRAASTVVSSQIKIHAEYGGVVPELATREHLRNLQPVVRETLRRANLEPGKLDAIAATRGPGLPPALMVGWKAAQSMAYALNCPLMSVNHVQGHLYSPWFTGEPPVADWGRFQPNLSLIVSGGHSLLVHVTAPLDHQILGSTLDDAAGECFDKIAKQLGLGYPGGPEVDRLARGGNPSVYSFARPMLNQPNDDFSFSGLKTSVRYFLEKNPELAADNARLPDLCASAQAAIVEVLVKKTIRAAKRERVRCLTLSGGVACNSELRKQLQVVCDKNAFTLRLASPDLCTDNAAMIGLLAEKQFAEGIEPEPIGADIQPGMALTKRL